MQRLQIERCVTLFIDIHIDFHAWMLDTLLPQRQYSELLLRVALAVVTVDRCALQARGGAPSSASRHSPTKRHCYPPGADEGTRPPTVRSPAQATQLVLGKGFLQGDVGVTFMSSVTLRSSSASR